MSDFDIRLRRYTAGGSAGPVLPTTDLDWTAPQSDIPTLTFKVAEAITGELPDLLEVAVELWNGQAWKEPDNGRFFVVKNSKDDLDETGVKSCTGVAMNTFLLSNALLINRDGKQRIVNGSVGGFLQEAFNEALSRGVGVVAGKTVMATSFDKDRDSAGNAWVAAAQLAAQAFDSGEKYTAILQILADQAFIEYSFSGRTLNVFNPGTGEDRSVGTGRVTVGSVSDELPVDTNLEDLSTHILVRGDDGLAWTFDVPGAEQSMGRLEKVVDASGVTERRQAAAVAELYQTIGVRPRKQYTVTETAQAMTASPLFDFNVGDWVSARRPHGWERMRVTQVQVRKGTDGLIQVDIILADRLEDQATRIAKRNAALGARRAGNGNLGRSSEAAVQEPAEIPDVELIATDKIIRLNAPGSPRVVATDGNGRVFGFTDHTKSSIMYPPSGGYIQPPWNERGWVDLWSGYLKDGNVLDMEHRKRLELPSPLMRNVWGGSSAGNRPPNATTDSGKETEYFVESAVMSFMQGAVSLDGWLYIPLSLTVRWVAAIQRYDAVITKRCIRFIRVAVPDDLTQIGELEAVSKLNITNGSLNYTGDMTASGGDVVIRTYAKEVGASVEKPATVAFTINPETRDIDDNGLIWLPATNMPEAGGMAILPSLNGSGGRSLVNTVVGELELADDRMGPREEGTKWRFFEGKQWQQTMVWQPAAAFDMAIGFDGYDLTVVGNDGPRLEGRSIEEGVGINPLAYNVFHEGRIYSFGNESYGYIGKWASALITPANGTDTGDPGDIDIPGMPDLPL